MNEFKLVPVEPTREMLDAPLQGGRFENRVDLRPSIYRAMLAAAPAVQGEPVGEVRFEFGVPSLVYAELYSETLPSLEPGTKLYAAPQPATQPAPDVAGLVEALTMARETIAFALRTNAPDYFTTNADIARHVVIQRIDAALAAHRKQGGEV